MNRTRVGFFAVILLVAACSQPQGNSGANGNPLAGDPNVDSWGSVQSADIAVPHGVVYRTSDVSGATVAEISSVPENAMSSGKTGGLSVRMSAQTEAQASGGSVRVVVRAFAAADVGQLGVAYSTNEAGNSGWIRFPLTRTPADYVFVYAVPVLHAGNGDYLGFRSYGNANVSIVGFKVEATPAAPAAAPAPAQIRSTTSP